MKKFSGICYFSVLVFSCFLFGITTGFSEARALTLTLADSTAPIGLRGEGVKILVEEIEKHTNGEVKVQVHWGGSLLKSKEILGGIQDGIVDIGYINSNYYPKQMRVNSIFSLFPQGPKKFSNISWFYENAFEKIPEIKAELQRLKLKPIYTNTVLPLAVVSTKPLNSFEDFKGKKFRASSRWVLAQLEAAGSIPVSLPWGDCYMALQTNSIDGVFSNRDGEHRTKLDEVAPNIFAMKEIWAAVPFIYAMNLDKWNSLSKKTQQQLTEAGQAAVLRFEQLWEAEWSRTETAQKKMGANVVNATAEDISKWANMPVNDELQKQWIKEATAAGVKNADQVMASLKKLLAEAMARD